MFGRHATKNSYIIHATINTEIITFVNYNGPYAGPKTLLGPYILSLVNVNRPAYTFLQ